MKKSILLVVLPLLLTSCQSNSLTWEVYENDRKGKIYNDYETSTFKEEFPFDYESYATFIDNNFVQYSYYKLFPKDAKFCSIIPTDRTNFKVGYESKTNNKTYFVENFHVINDDLRNMDLSSGGDDSWTGPSRETLEIDAVFYPTLNTEKDYKLVIDYSYPKSMRVKIEGNNGTFGYIYSYCRTDLSEYENIFLKYIDENLVFHLKESI